MTVITKCANGGCFLKYICYLYTAPENDAQSYFDRDPVGGKGCNEFQYHDDRKSTGKVNGKWVEL